MPWTMEGVVMPAREAVRECPLCAPGFQCAHFEGLRIVICSVAERAAIHTCDFGEWFPMETTWIVSGPCPSDAWIPCDECGTDMGAFEGPGYLSHYDTEAEARAEFARRVAMMLGREQEES